MIKIKTCCFSGRRKLTKEQKELAVVGLLGFIELAIKDGYTHFISGFAEGIDLIAANIIVKNKIRNKNLFLEAAIPCLDRFKTKDKNFQELLEKSNGIYLVQKEYSSDCYFKRNRYMVDNSDLLIAVWDGIKSGGTYQTLQYAEKQGKEIKIIPIEGSKT